MWTGIGPDDHPDDPLDALRDAAARLHTPRGDAGLPPLTGGLVGYLGYDAVRRMERLPVDRRRRPRDARAALPARDRPRRARPPDGIILLIANVIRGLTPDADDDPGAAYDEAVARLER